MAAFFGECGLFGVVPVRPLRGFPEGRVKVQMRPEGWLRAVVMNSQGARRFYVREEAGHWVPWLECDANWRALEVGKARRWEPALVAAGSALVLATVVLLWIVARSG